MNIIKAFANYGVLSHEKKMFLTVNDPSHMAAYSEEVEVILPEGFEADLNHAGEQLITTPTGEVFLAKEILGVYSECPSLSWYDKNGKLHWVKCKLA